jgi:WD40 repeat protein
VLSFTKVGNRVTPFPPVVDA